MGNIKVEHRNYPNFTCSLALAKAGLIVKLKAANTVTLAGAGDIAFGVALKNTEDPLTPGSYLTGQPVAVMFQGVAELQLPATNKTIAVGNKLVTAATGYVNKGSFAATNAIASAKELQNRVGVALEAKGSSVGGTIKALVNINPTLANG